MFWVRMLHAARAGADHFVMGAPLVVRGLVLHLCVTRRLVEDSCNSLFLCSLPLLSWHFLTFFFYRPTAFCKWLSLP